MSERERETDRQTDREERERTVHRQGQRFNAFAYEIFIVLTCVH